MSTQILQLSVSCLFFVLTLLSRATLVSHIPFHTYTHTHKHTDKHETIFPAQKKRLTHCRFITQVSYECVIHTRTNTHTLIDINPLCLNLCWQLPTGQAWEGGASRAQWQQRPLLTTGSQSLSATHTFHSGFCFTAKDDPHRVFTGSPSIRRNLLFFLLAL